MNSNQLDTAPDWEKVLAILNHESAGSTELTAEEQELLQELKKIKIASKDDGSLDFRTEEKLAEAMHRLSFIKDKEIIRKQMKLWRFIGASAAMIAVIFGTGLFYYIKKTQHTSSYLNDVAPGKQGATLTLGNGRKIKLSEAITGDLAEESGIVVSKTRNGSLVYNVKDQNKTKDNQTNTLSTGRGETYEVRLPDGSLVWMNDASSLTYPTTLNERGQRVVKLQGEAYFEITKDKVHPFVVRTDLQEVEVLGTHFNINSYSDEPLTRTTLFEGSVRVSTPRTKQRIVISPGQEALNVNEQLQSKTANLDEAIAWKEGYFRFSENDLESIMRQISRWYNVEVVYSVDKSEFAGLKFWGFVSKNKRISEVLKIMERTEKVRFNIQGRTITVMK